MIQEDNVLPRATEPAIFVSTSCEERHKQALLAINLASQQKTTKLHFSFQVRKQFKLLAVPFKPLRCCLRNDKHVNCHCLKILQRSIFKLTRDLICQSNCTF